MGIVTRLTNHFVGKDGRATEQEFLHTHTLPTRHELVHDVASNQCTDPSRDARVTTHAVKHDRLTGQIWLKSAVKYQPTQKEQPIARYKDHTPPAGRHHKMRHCRSGQ